MPTVDRVLESSLYVDDLSRAVEFYVKVMQLRILVQDERFCALDASGHTVVLLFRRGGSLQPTMLPGGRIPAHDGAGPLHVAFAIPASEVQAWESHLQAHGVDIESKVDWPRGGKSIYFRDPDGHVLELATPGLWATY
jgi:catechol 2,3-dioxygenase-like lactoylglutathione lyase family enzyme